MTAPVRIWVREQVGGKVVQQVVEADIFDEAYVRLIELRTKSVRAHDVTRISVGPDGGAMQTAGAT